MSDHDMLVDELVSRAAMCREGMYTYGWRLYRDGRDLMPTADPYVVAGYNDAKHRVEALRTDISWSAKVADNYEQDEAVGFRRVETDRDTPPAR